MSGGVFNQPSHLYEFVEFSLEEFDKKSETFSSKFQKALRDGFFYLKTPDSCNSLIPEAVGFAEKLRSDAERLKELDLGLRTGYIHREGTQAVSFLVKEHQWKQVYPKKVCKLARKMNDVAYLILKETLVFLEVPKELWSIVTGGLTDGQISNSVFSLRNYQPEDAVIGLSPHRDFGWITVLFTNKSGLQVEINNNWIDVPPKKDWFIINWGQAAQTLFNNTAKLNAAYHQVVLLSEARISFGYFSNSHAEAPLYQLNKSNQLKVVTSRYDEHNKKCHEDDAKWGQERWALKLSQTGVNNPIQ